MDFKVCVVLPGAGCGVRMGVETPKQFCNVLNRPIISHTISAFERLCWIDRIVIVVAQTHKQLMNDIVSTFSHQRVTVVCGADARHRSIHLGLQEISKGDVPEVVVIHDAVRPFVPGDILTRVCQAAALYGAAGAMRPLVSTVIDTDEDGFMRDSLDRSRYRASEMPQAFRFDFIQQAYKQATDYELDHGTECLQLCQRYSDAKVKLIEGPDCLWKVTHKRDLHAFEGMLKEKSNVVVCGDVSQEIQSHLSVCLKEKGLQYHFSEANTSSSSSEDVNSVICAIGHINSVAQTISTAVQQVSHSGAVIVLFSGEEEKQLKSIVREHAKMAKQCAICVNGIMGNDAPSIGKLAACLVFDRNLTFSGQVFSAE